MNLPRLEDHVVNREVRKVLDQPSSKKSNKHENTKRPRNGFRANVFQNSKQPFISRVGFSPRPVFFRRARQGLPGQVRSIQIPPPSFLFMHARSRLPFPPFPPSLPPPALSFPSLPFRGPFSGVEGKGLSLSTTPHLPLKYGKMKVQSPDSSHKLFFCIRICVLTIRLPTPHVLLHGMGWRHKQSTQVLHHALVMGCATKRWGCVCAMRGTRQARTCLI